MAGRGHGDDATDDGAAFGLPSRRQAGVGLGYAAAAALYIAIGLVLIDFVFSVFVAIAYLLVVAWLVPAVVRRLR